MAIRAADEAIKQAGWNAQQLHDPQTMLVVGTSKGPVEAWITPLSHMAESQYVVGGLSMLSLASIASAVGDAFGVGGHRLTYSAACASGLHALIGAALGLMHGPYRRALVVASEASVHPLFLGSFKRLGVLPRPGVGCLPFDQAREGFLMSEAAAAVCIESGPVSEQSKARTWGVIERFALGGDATHLTGGDLQATTLRHLLRQVIDIRPVDLIHAHGTGTEYNDPTELAALEASLISSQTPPLVYSHKAAMGHSLGAAGLVAVVLNCLMHRKGMVLPNVRTTRPLPVERVRISQQIERRDIGRSLVIASGFGGATAVVSLIRP